jgi:hypothetical protein
MTAPPLVAVVSVIEDTAVVVTVGRTAGHGPQVGIPLQKDNV